MKNYLGLPVLERTPNWQAMCLHILNIILTVALGYFLVNITYATLTTNVPFKFNYIFALFSEADWAQAGHAFWNETQRFIQPNTPMFWMQTIFLFIGFILGYIFRLVQNHFGMKNFHYKYIDMFLYPIGILVALILVNVK